MKKLCKISIYDCNKNNRDMIFSLPEEVSEEERSTVEELQAVLVSDKWVNYGERRVAFGKFISNAIGDAILHSQEREFSKGEMQEEQSR